MGIQHLDDLPPDDLLKLCDDWPICEVQEKLDGVHLRAGRDQSGRFFTSRVGKGGKIYWDAAEYPEDFWASDFRSAHQALEHWRGLRAGDEIEIELLAGGQANAVVYDRIRRIVITRGTAKARLPQQVLTRLVVPVTPDGRTIQRVPRRDDWLICRLPLLAPDESILPRGEIAALRAYLDQQVGPGMTVREVLAVKLSHEPVAHRDGLRVLRDQVRGETKRLVGAVCRPIVTAMTVGAESYCGGGAVEGFVVSHPDGIRGKIVDREVFTVANRFYWLWRDRIADLTRPSWGDLDRMLTEYLGERGNLRLITGNRSLRYSQAVHRRTLESFAAAFAKVKR